METFSCGNIENLPCLTGIKSCKFTKIKTEFINETTERYI